MIANRSQPCIFRGEGGLAQGFPAGRCRQKRRPRASFRVNDRYGHLGADGVAHLQGRSAVRRILAAAPQAHDIPWKARRRPDCSRLPDGQGWAAQTCRDCPHWLADNF